MDAFFNSFLCLLPCLCPEPVQLRRPSLKTYIFLYQMHLFYGYVQSVAFGIIDYNMVFRGAFKVHGFEPPEDTYAVINVDHIIIQFQVDKRGERDPFSGLSRLYYLLLRIQAELRQYNYHCMLFQCFTRDDAETFYRLHPVAIKSYPHGSFKTGREYVYYISAHAEISLFGNSPGPLVS